MAEDKASERDRGSRHSLRQALMVVGGFVVGIIATLLVVNVISPKTSDSAVSVSTAATTVAETSAASSTAAASQEAPSLSMGESYTTDEGLQVTVTGLGTATSWEKTEATTVSVTFVNNGTSDIFIDISSWEAVVDSEVVSAGYYVQDDGMLQPMTLVPGGEKTAHVDFEGTGLTEIRYIQYGDAGAKTTCAKWVVS